jgi:uncharacterized protein YdaU (DUF1376 family)
MPLYIGDFLADTMDLNATETGIYIRLIMHCFQHGSVPDDPGRLRLIAGCSLKTWRSHCNILHFFQRRDSPSGSHYIHIRVSRERHKSEEKSRKNKERYLNSVKIQPTQSQSLSKSIGLDKESKPPRFSKKQNGYPKDFEDWWLGYPRTPTMSKSEALKAWQRLDPDDCLKAAAATPKYAAYLKTKPDLPAVHACRFLSQRRFDGFAEGVTGGPSQLALEIQRLTEQRNAERGRDATDHSEELLRKSGDVHGGNGREKLSGH